MPTTPENVRPRHLSHKKTAHALLTDLLLLESDTNYTWLLWRTGQRTLMARTLRYFETQIPADQFVRLHRQYLVNVAFIYTLERPEPHRLVVRLQNGERIEVSRRRQAQVRSHLQRHLHLARFFE
jgi:DNA-binding LytR/AlgR family response regulator